MFRPTCDGCFMVALFGCIMRLVKRMGDTHSSTQYHSISQTLNSLLLWSANGMKEDLLGRPLQLVGKPLRGLDGQLRSPFRESGALSGIGWHSRSSEPCVKKAGKSLVL